MKGAVSSDLNKDYIQSNIKLGEEDDLKRQLLGIIEPSEIADCIVFLLSDSSKKITGTSILLDGGYVL
jgi:NAD(P)-dependent dehydrogenase (short-subunit alcohol dehydrogenase family)